MPSTKFWKQLVTGWQLAAALSAFGWAAAGHALAEEPLPAPQLTKAEAKQLLTDGDRLADQADYRGALEKYTEAYHAIVSKIRGQEFKRRVLPNLLTRTELGEEILRMMQKEYTPEELELIDATYKAFGLMSKEMSSKELMTKLLTEQVGGFYDPDVKRMVLIREDSQAKNPGFLERLLGTKPAFDKDEQKTTLAHEMTHALQDQLYDLKSMQTRVEKDDDMLLAFSALVEGDATLLMFDEMDDSGSIADMDPDAIRTTFTLMSFMLPVAGGESFRKAPAIFRESLIFPYFQGMLFNIAVAGKKGWPAIHQAYKSPPVSTEQILHPEKYVGGQPDEPQLVVLPQLESVVGDGWEHLGGNCMGEFQTSILLRRLRSGKRAAAGWDGDRYEIFSKKADGQSAFVFISVWDSPKDAEEFAQSYRETRTLGNDQPDEPPAKESDQATVSRGLKPEDEPPAPDRATRSTESSKSVLGGEMLVEVHGDRVWVIEGFSAETTKTIHASLDQVRCEPKKFPEKP